MTPICVWAITSFSRPITTKPTSPTTDLIILDLGLPAGDGFVVLGRFKTNTYVAMIPVLVVSARDAHANRERALKAGARAYLQKPWNDTDLLANISQLLGPLPVAAGF
jgi:chemotaxis family two-component system sensor histidine kinase/response regulator PixL